MKMNDVLNTIQAIEGAVMCRANKTNFIAIPVEDGIVKVNVGMALDKDTKNHKAFNFDAAKAEYTAYTAEKALKVAERANKPVKEKGVNVEAQARRDAVDKAITALPSFTDYTATDIHKAVMGQVPESTTVMAIGSSAMRLVDNGVLTVEVKGEGKGKKYYTKA